MMFDLTSPPRQTLHGIIRRGILRSLNRHDWILVDAARELGKHPSTLTRLVSKYGLRKPPHQRQARRLLGRAGGRPRKPINA